VVRRRFYKAGGRDARETRAYDDGSPTPVPFSRERRPAVNRPSGQLLIAAGIIVILIGLWIYWNSNNNPPPPEGPAPTQPEGKPSPADSSIHLTMGNPSGATDDPEKPDNFLMRKPYFALSYNNAKGTPNWVSWCLKEGDLGHIQRDARFQQGELSFRPDPELLDLRKKWPTFQVVKPADYAGSGFDRGHMCPFGDRTSSEEAAASTFVMTNMVPQSPNCNQKAWADLEDYCRDLVRKKHQTLYIVSGPQGRGGEGKEGPKEVIGRAEKVTVPAKCWKVVLALDDGKGGASDVSRVNRDSRVFAVVMPNDMSVGHGWAKYRTSVKEVEELTSYHFFDRVPASVIGPLKGQVDKEHISPERHHKGED
jgi:endonuclease G